MMLKKVTGERHILGMSSVGQHESDFPKCIPWAASSRNGGHPIFQNVASDSHLGKEFSCHLQWDAGSTIHTWKKYTYSYALPNFTLVDFQLKLKN